MSEENNDDEGVVVSLRPRIEMGDRRIIREDTYCIHYQASIDVNAKELRCAKCRALMCPYEYINREMVNREGALFSMMKQRDELQREIETLKILRNRHKSSVKGFQKRAETRKPPKMALVASPGKER